MACRKRATRDWRQSHVRATTSLQMQACTQIWGKQSDSQNHQASVTCHRGICNLLEQGCAHHSSNVVPTATLPAGDPGIACRRSRSIHHAPATFFETRHQKPKAAQPTHFTLGGPSSGTCTAHACRLDFCRSAQQLTPSRADQLSKRAQATTEAGAATRCAIF